MQLLGRVRLESTPNNEAILLLTFPFNGDKTAGVSIFRLFSSGATDMQKSKLPGQDWNRRAERPAIAKNTYSGVHGKVL